MKTFFEKPYFYLFIILVGISLKFYKVEQKFFWDDEIATVLHTSGISLNDYEKQIPVNTIFPRSYFDNILNLNERNLKLSDQIIGLSLMPQLTPAHYYYLIFWVRLFGDQYISYRYFSIVIFILSLPFLFLLTKKLFRSSTAGWIAASLYAVSPFFHSYTQEARYYILWSLAVLIMHYLFLMASENQNRLWWGIYILAGILAIHTTILISILFIMHLTYYLIFHRKNWKPFFIGLGIISLFTLPWLIFIYRYRNAIDGSLTWQLIDEGHINIGEILMFQLKNIAFVFFDARVFKFDKSIFLIINFTILLLSIISLIIIFKKAGIKQFLFVVLATFTGIIVLGSLDFFRNSFTSNLPRYHLQNYIGALLMFAFAGKTLLEKSSVLFGILFITFIIGGILSSKAISDNPAFGNRFDSRYNVADAEEYFSGNQHVLIISDYYPFAYTTFMSVIKRSKNKNIDCIYAKADYPDFANNFNLKVYDKVYALNLSEKLEENLKQCFQEKMVVIRDKPKYVRIFEIQTH